MARRVFQIAKELGVKSTSVVSKCQAEGLEIKNHMSTLSAGLEATIREWFTMGESANTVETTAPVDLDKVKTKKKRSRKKETKEEPASSTAVASEEPPVEPVKEPPVVEEVSLEEDLAKASKLKAPKTPKTPKARKSARPKRKSPKELEKDEITAGPIELPSKVTAVKVKKIGTKKPVTDKHKKEPPEKAAVAELEEKVDEELSAGPRIIRTIVPTKIEAKKAVSFVPAPAVLQGPKVIRTETEEKRPARPSRGPRRSTKVAVADVSVPTIPRSVGGAGSRHSRKRQDAGEETGEKDKKHSKAHSRRRSLRKQDTGTEQAGPHEWGDRDWQERQERLAQASGSKLHRRERLLAQEEQSGAGGTALIEPHRIEKAVVKEPITVKELSAGIGIRVNEIIEKLMVMGVMATVNDVLDVDSAMTVALEFGVELTVEEKALLWDNLKKKYDEESASLEQSPRPPIVTFLGHVDHGKTSLLDRIRQSRVVTGEAGGITQHIGSYQYDDGRHCITFLDTPGHKAFTEMRARGANMTDVAVLVIAADDGVMPQTEEAINHVRAAQVPILVALNKMDLPNSDENRVLGQLSEHGLVPAEWGGDTEVVRTSATTGDGVEDLLEHLEYIAELRHLKAHSTGPATGWVIESEMTPQQGVIATLLVKSGKLQLGDVLVSGSSHGRVRTITDASGRVQSEAGPAMPIQVAGLDVVPVAGDGFYVVKELSYAANVSREQQNQRREKTLARRRQVTLENLFSELEAGELRKLNVIIKADVQGSLDVLSHTIMEMNTSEVAVRVLHAAVGGITESDVVLAMASEAIIIGFQVIAEEYARNMAEREGVEIRHYRVIYQITDDIRKMLEGMLKPQIKEKPVGRAEIRQVFRISRVGVVSGCIVTEGIIKRSSRLRVVRDSVVIRDNNPIASIRRVKDDVSEVRNGLECGIKLEGFDDLKTGDMLEAYELIEISRKLDSVN